jgi:8-oxo-dGTP diphosphatase
MIDLYTTRSCFHHVLPDIRLGQQHHTYNDFLQHVHLCSTGLDTKTSLLPNTAPIQELSLLPNINNNDNNYNIESRTTLARTTTRKEYTLIVVTEYNTKRILLGQKHRGFGKGMYNSFGGKVESHETNAIATSAIRELYEETGIKIKNETDMAQCRIGTLYFTFEDDTIEMVVHLFRINILFDDDYVGEETMSIENQRNVESGDIKCSDKNNDNDDISILTKASATGTIIINVPSRSTIRGCDEITPIWFDDWACIPLHNMFADDSIWLTYLLHSTTSTISVISTDTSVPTKNVNNSNKNTCKMDGWFHFQRGGQETNTILHYYIDDRTNNSNNKLLN